MAKQSDVFSEAESHERSRQTKCNIPEWFVDKLLETFDSTGIFKLPVEKVNTIVGYQHANHRAPAIRKQLNTHYSAKLQDNQVFYVGTTEKDTKYVFGIEVKEA